MLTDFDKRLDVSDKFTVSSLAQPQQKHGMFREKMHGLLALLLPPLYCSHSPVVLWSPEPLANLGQNESFLGQPNSHVDK